MSDLFWDSTLGSILNWSFFLLAFHFLLIIVAALPSPSVPHGDLLQNPIWRVSWAGASLPARDVLHQRGPVETPSGGQQKRFRSAGTFPLR